MGPTLSVTRKVAPPITVFGVTAKYDSPVTDIHEPGDHEIPSL